MAEVIDFNGEKFIDASAISGIKKVLIATSATQIDSLRTLDDTGIYYCQNRADTPTPYGMLIAMSAAGDGASGYQLFVSSTIRLFARYYTSNAWTNWYEVLNSNIDFGLGGHLSRTTTTSDNKSVVNFGSNALYPASSLYGSMKGRISSGDLNDYIGTEKAGMYYLSAGAASYTNAPDGFGYLLVFSDSTSLSGQLFFKSTGLYFRTYSSGAWNAWQKAAYGPAAIGFPEIRQHRTGYDNSKMIDFGSGVLVDASGIGGVKDTITSAGVVDTLNKLEQSGVYYVSNVSDTPYTYGMLMVMASGSGSSGAYQVFIDTTNHMYQRYRSSNAWSTWYRMSGSPFDANGISYDTPRVYSFTMANGATNHVRFTASSVGLVLTASAYTAARGVYEYYTPSNGIETRVTTVAAASGITVQQNLTQGLEIINNSEHEVLVRLLLTNGTVAYVGN